MADTKIQIPDAPAGLPAKVAQKWKDTYQASFKEAQDDFPEDLVMQRQVALRDANRTLRFKDPENYEEAKRLEDWHVVLRTPSEDGKTLRVVTRHGRKFTFPIPEKDQKPAAPAV